MKLATGITLFFCLLMGSPAWACIRPTIDERAVQWSTSIVIAKLEKIDPPAQLAGSIQERRGNLGILGTAETVYFSRVYHFMVEKKLDGAGAAGESISVLRLTSRTEEPQMNCGQHLTPDAMGKSFILLLRPFSMFPGALPFGITRPPGLSLQCIIHMEEMATLKPEDLTTIQNTIDSTRAAEASFDQKTADRLLGKIGDTVNNLRAAPSIRAFEKFGMKGMPALDAAIAGSPQSTPAYSHLMAVKNEMMPPTSLFGQIGTEPKEGADGRRR
jgi:hypothetical protein